MHAPVIGKGARRAARAVPWLVVAAVMVGALLWAGTPATQLGRYGLYWILGLALPGTLVYRALRGSRGNLPEDVGFGAVTGLAMELPAWAVAVGLGLQDWLWAWPVPVVALFVAVPGLRRYWRIAEPEPLPARWSWLTAAVMIAIIVSLATSSWGGNPLPPAGHSLFNDIYYHWANSAELTRTITPQQPQMAGPMLRYHWFSDAHRAAAHMITDVPLATVMLRLWDGPIAVATTLVVAGLARQVIGAWWTGPLAAFFALVFNTAAFWPAFAGYSSPVISWWSPTLTYSIPVLVAALALLVDVARGVPLGRAWPLLGLLALIAAGAKPSSMPVLAGGVLVAIVARGVLTRSPPVGLLAALACVVGALAFTAAAIAGGLSGARMQIGATVSFKTEYMAVLGPRPIIPGAGDGLFPAGFGDFDLDAQLFLPAILGVVLLTQLSRWLGLAVLLRPGPRRDPAAWLLAGVTVAGLAGFLLVGHIANGQIYFLASATPAGTVLTAWLVAELVPKRRAWLVVAGGLALGGLLALALTTWGPGRPDPRLEQPWPTQWPGLLGRPVLALAVVLAAGALIWLLARWRWRGLAGSGPALLIAVVLGLGCYIPGVALRLGVASALDGRLPATGSHGQFFTTTEEQRAALWVARHVPSRDIIATNVHCEGVVAREGCAVRTFWLSALGEHRVVLEGWAYQVPTEAAHGRNGLPYYRQPAPEPDRLRCNDRVFTAPSAEAIAELRERYGAGWLFADSRAAPVSPDLGRYATERYRDGPVTIYQL